MVKRNARTATMLIGVLLVALALAGCTSNPPATASQLQPTSDAHAQAWDSDARLVAAIGIEGTIQVRSLLGEFGEFDSEVFEEAAEEDFWDRVQDDPDPGNGKAEFWVYVYSDPNGRSHLVVVVDRDEKVIYRTETDDWDSSAPIGEYSVDSDDAMRIALGENSGLAGAKQTDAFAFVLSLFRDSAEPEMGRRRRRGRHGRRGWRFRDA